MRILVVGCGKYDFNHRKIEGFYNAFSKIGETEWVSKMFECKYDEYDIVFGEINLSEIYKNLDKFLKMKIKVQIMWRTYSYDKLDSISKLKKDTHFVNAYKSNLLDQKICKDFIDKYKDKSTNYQVWEDEGVDIVEFLKDYSLPENIELCYLPCSLSEKEEYQENKQYDICYFGTILNRPGVKNCLEILSNKYSILTNAWDIAGIKSPKECYDLYKSCKVTLSEQVHPVILEYPVRIGESTSTGCKPFLLESIKCKDYNNKLIPDYESCDSVQDMVNKIDEYLSNYDNSKSKNLYDNFLSTYDNAVKFLLEKIKEKL